MIVGRYLAHSTVEAHGNSRGVRVGFLGWLRLAGFAIGEMCGTGASWVA
jgi:hypothetical protein